MKSLKNLRRRIVSYLTGSLFSYLLYAFIWLLGKSMRVTYLGSDIMPGFAARRDNFIGAFWHSRLLMLPLIYVGSSIHILISSHRDGEIIANVMRRFGFDLVRGSSKKRGMVALRQMLDVLEQGRDLGITPDGPKGPAEVVKGGVVQAAISSGKPVLPISYAAAWQVRATSWDRFVIPLPFSRLVFVVGKPLYHQPAESHEEFRLRIENGLREATARADSYFA